MSKTKIFAFSALWAMLFSCGSQDGGPPELTKSTLDPISPFDILKVGFNSDIIELDTSSIIGDVTLIPSNNKRELHFVGKNKTPGGSLHFHSGLMNDLIELKNLKNSDGYVKEQTIVKFSTYRILDKEPNNRETDANDIGSSDEVERGIPFAGVIDKEIGEGTDGFDNFDRRDFYKLDLKAGDIISITASNQGTPFNVKFYGPCLEGKDSCNDTTFAVTQKTATIKNTITAGHLSSTDPYGKMDTFYIEVSDLSEKSNPYLLTVTVE
jgi:hypothetical protein